MKLIIRLSQFGRDFRKALKQHRSLAAFEIILHLLVQGKHPPLHYRPHKLQGEYAQCWECHLGADLLLIYRIDPDAVYLVRMGRHEDLFE